ncbi:MAG TPA: serine hydrolase domain-containing protein [Candidatus Acidoferrales bacterium]|nr:serine hydrolase domain-containing protein [Candidatus Acidoferrales bacterium]
MQSASGAQAQIPDTPAGRRLGEWLKTFNSGEREAIRAFREQGFKNPPRRPLGDDLDFREETGGFELRRILEATPTRISAQLKEKKSEQFAEINVEVEPEEPHQIVAFGLRAVPRPASEPSLRMPEAEALAAAAKRAGELCASGEFSGTVLVARSGRTLLSRACGEADREKKIANRLDTKFNLGSMNKMFTATAVLQLVEQGKIRLEDGVGKYLTDYPNREVAEKVTIHELLTHTGGTGDIFGPAYRENRDKLRSPGDYVALYGTRGPEFEPGSRFEYSNYGFVLLGAVIEKVSGKSYYEYVREHIFGPAGMKDTDSYLASAEVANRAIGYMRMDPGGPLEANTITLPPRGSPAGGGYSTAEDLVRFAEALTGNKLLSAKSTELLTTGKAGPPGRMYAYGFQDEREDGVRMIGHNGGSPGVNAILHIYPESGYVVVALANLDPTAARNMADFIGARLPAK